MLKLRTIALISHASKVMLKILQARLQQYVNCELPDVQPGFRNGRATRVQISSICQIIEKVKEFQKKVYFCSIECAKAFDSVDHNKLWKILKIHDILHLYKVQQLHKKEDGQSYLRNQGSPHKHVSILHESQKIRGNSTCRKQEQYVVNAVNHLSPHTPLNKVGLTPHTAESCTRMTSN